MIIIPIRNSPKYWGIFVLTMSLFNHREAIMGGLELDQLSYQEVLKPQWNSQEMRMKVGSLCIPLVFSLGKSSKNKMEIFNGICHSAS